MKNKARFSVLLLSLLVPGMVASAAGAAKPKEKPFILPHPSTDCAKFTGGKIDGQPLLTALSKKVGEQLSQAFVPKGLVKVPEAILNPQAVKWAKIYGPKVPDSTMYQHLVRAEALKAFQKMAQDAKTDGVNLIVYSAYRSFTDQCYVFSEKLRDADFKATDAEDAKVRKQAVHLVSAYPGRSEHQLGTAFDITTPSVEYTIDSRFEGTPEFAWLTMHAPKYGFAMSYPKHEGLFHPVTGYVYEPWHWRYLGEDAADDFKEAKATQGLTLIEFLRKLRDSVI